MRGGYDGERGRRTPTTDPQDAHQVEEEEEEGQDEKEMVGEPEPSPRETIILEESYPPRGLEVDSYPPSEIAGESYPPPGLEEDHEEEEEDDDALEVVVETLLGDTYRVRVSRWDTVAAIKGLLSRTQGIPISQQHLLLGQTELLDEVTLIEQSVVDGSKLRLVLAMRGGPINAPRLPTHDDLFWREVANRDDIWDVVGGRTVTLLVLRDGENVNLYRVIENEDGSFSPLNESWGSVKSGDVHAEEEPYLSSQAAKDEEMTRARMADVRAQMEALKVRNKKKSERKEVKENLDVNDSNDISSQHEIANAISWNALDVKEGQIVSSRPNTRPRSGSGGKRLKTISRRGGRGSRPNTQERSIELRRTSISRGSTRLKEIPTAVAPKPVTWQRKKPLDNIPARGISNRLPAVDEEIRNRSGHSFIPPEAQEIHNRRNDYASYRKSLVKHTKKSSKNDSRKDSQEAWPRRDGPTPMYMAPDTAPRSRYYDAGPLHQSLNQDSLRLAQRTPNIRPKTSPEVLEHTPATTSNQSTISERIHLRDTDERVRDLCTILNTSRANSRHSNHSSLSPPGTANPSSLTSSFNGSNGFSSINKASKSLSLSVGSLKNSIPASSPGPGALVASGSREQRDILRGLMNSKRLGSRRSTPEERRVGQRQTSGRHQASPTRLPPVTPQKRKARRKPRCDQCSRRLLIGTTYECRCHRVFCAQHRYAEEHACTFDYRAEGRRLLQISNPVVAPHKLPKI